MGNRKKEAFLNCSDVLFNGLPSEDTIISGIKDVPVSARSVERCISEMAENVNKQQTVVSKDAVVFRVALDESVDINDIPRLEVVRYCDSDGVREELCCLKSMHGTITG